MSSMCLFLWLLLHRSQVVICCLVIAKPRCSHCCFSFVPVNMTNHWADFRPALLQWDTSHLGNKLAWLLSRLRLKWLSVMWCLKQQREHFNNATWALENFPFPSITRVFNCWIYHVLIPPPVVLVLLPLTLLTSFDFYFVSSNATQVVNLTRNMYLFLYVLLSLYQYVLDVELKQLLKVPLSAVL